MRGRRRELLDAWVERGDAAVAVEHEQRVGRVREEGGEVGGGHGGRQSTKVRVARA